MQALPERHSLDRRCASATLKVRSPGGPRAARSPASRSDSAAEPRSTTLSRLAPSAGPRALSERTSTAVPALDGNLHEPEAAGCLHRRGLGVIKPLAVARPGRPCCPTESQVEDRFHRDGEPIAHSDAISRGSAGGKSNELSIRRPDGNSHHHARIFFESDLARAARRQRQHPQIAVASTVGQIGHFVICRIEGGVCTCPVWWVMRTASAHILGRDRSSTGNFQMSNSMCLRLTRTRPS